jgi:predicted transcriptional regulator
MSKRKVAATSRAAYDTLTVDRLRDDYKNIMSALSVLIEATSEQIAAKLKCKPDKIWKRLSEMKEKEVIYKPGNRRPLKSGCMGFTWSLTEKGKQMVESSQELLPGKSVQDLSREIQKSTYKPNTLF